MLCKYCGAELPDGTEKCGFCGAELAEEQSLEDTKIIEMPEGETADEPETETEAEPEEEILDENEIKRREQMEKMLEEKRLQLSEIEKRRNVKKRRQQQTRILIIAAVCLAGVIAVASWSYLVKNNQDNTVVVTPPPTATPTATVPVLTPTPRTTTPEPLGSTAPARDSERTWEATGNNSGTSTASGTSGTSSSGGTSGGSTAATSGGSTASTSGTSSGGSASNAGGTGSSQSANASALSSAKASGAASHTIDAKLSVGGEVIKDGGKNLMTFASGGTLYYANVSEGSTTEQIKHQDITVTAYPTEESYNGNTIYEITSLTYYNGDDYILPNSGTKTLTTSDIKSLSKSQLALARNEIYARHGRKFQHAEFRDYFSKKSWYRENENYNYSDESLNLNEIEIKNVEFLLKAENSR